jgi:hypothetical protein
LYCAAGLRLQCGKPPYGHGLWIGNARYAEAVFGCRKKGRLQETHATIRSEGGHREYEWHLFIVNEGVFSQFQQRVSLCIIGHKMCSGRVVACVCWIECSKREELVCVDDQVQHVLSRRCEQGAELQF